jgi:hypothetical protein
MVTAPSYSPRLLMCKSTVYPFRKLRSRISNDRDVTEGRQSYCRRHPRANT